MFCAEPTDGVKDALLWVATLNMMEDWSTGADFTYIAAQENLSPNNVSYPITMILYLFLNTPKLYTCNELN